MIWEIRILSNGLLKRGKRENVCVCGKEVRGRLGRSDGENRERGRSGVKGET